MSKYDNYGGYFAPKGVMRVEAGGSHAENPNGGVQIGMDEQGVPNLLEEGEPVFNDYVFSDNIYAKGGVLKKFNVPERFAGKLYSEIADYYINEVDGMELDPIANRGLNANLVRLMNAQEEQKMEKERRELEKMLSQMSPEELAALEQELAAAEGGQEMPVQEQVPADQQMMAQAPVEEAVPMEMPVGQAPLMAACGGPIHRFDMGGPAGSSYGGGSRGDIHMPSLLEIALGPDNRIVQTVGKVQDWMDNSTAGKVVDFLLPDGAIGAVAGPGVKGAKGVANVASKAASKEATVAAAEEAAYRELAEQAANTGAQAGTRAAANATVKRPHWLQWFVDPKYYWRNGATPKGWGKFGAGVHSGIVGATEVGGAIDMGVNAWNKIADKAQSSGNLPVGEGIPFNNGGHLYWPGGPFVRTSGYRVVDGTPHVWSVNTGWGYGLPTTGSQVGSGIFKPGLIDDTSLVDQIQEIQVVGNKPTKGGSGNVIGISSFAPKLTPQQRMPGILPDPLEKVEWKDKDSIINTGKASTNAVVSGLAEHRSPNDEVVVDNPGRGLLTTLPRYAGVVGNSIAALSDAFAKPDSIVQNYAQPVLPIGRMDLQPVVYNPTDMNHLANTYAAQMTGANRMLRNSGLGPSVGANIIAANNSGMQNLGSAMLQGRAANNQLMNNVITANNQSAAQKANFDYTLDAARANILNDYRYRRAMNDMNVQQYNNAQDTAKWTALGQQLGNVWQGLSDIGNENFAMNQVNSNPALFYRTTQNGGVYYDPMHSDYLEYWRDYFAKHPEKLNGKKTEGGK